jgi:hypothetical protein
MNSSLLPRNSNLLPVRPPITKQKPFTSLSKQSSELSKPELYKSLVKPTEDEDDSDTNWLNAPLSDSEKNDRRIRLMGEKISNINMKYHGNCSDFNTKIPEWCRVYGKFDRGMRNEKLALLIFQQVFPNKLYTIESFTNVKGPKIEKNIRLLNETEKDTLESFMDNLLATNGGKRKTKKRRKNKSRRKGKKKRTFRRNRISKGL